MTHCGTPVGLTYGPLPRRSARDPWPTESFTCETPRGDSGSSTIVWESFTCETLPRRCARDVQRSEGFTCETFRRRAS